MLVLKYNLKIGKIRLLTFRKRAAVQVETKQDG